ncbi:hypothetical protein AB1L30_05450 [Bremerella sp. JC817]|uniref:hypothetical protein n=1 Tax=Bremerella sp. JC817 TaxID=3231756 RepID=UPI003459FA08
MSSLTLGLLIFVGGVLWKWLSGAKPIASAVVSSNVASQLRSVSTVSAAATVPTPRSQTEAFAAWLVLREVMQQQGATAAEIETAADSVAKRIMLPSQETQHEG